MLAPRFSHLQRQDTRGTGFLFRQQCRKHGRRALSVVLRKQPEVPLCMLDELWIPSASGHRPAPVPRRVSREILIGSG